MLSLYEESKAKTMSLCLMLLQSEKDADEAMVEVYTYSYRDRLDCKQLHENEHYHEYRDVSRTVEKCL